jgi:hypothetical protein
LGWGFFNFFFSLSKKKKEKEKGILKKKGGGRGEGKSEGGIVWIVESLKSLLSFLDL